MKFAVVFAAVLAVAAGAYSGFESPFAQAAKFVSRPAVAAARPVAAVVARATSSDQAASVLRYDNDISPEGAYNYAVETDNGIAFQAQGTPRDFGGNPPVVPVVAQGSYSYTSPEGQVITINYVADENGYQASGDAIPTPHPIPEAILKSLAYVSKYNQKK